MAARTGLTVAGAQMPVSTNVAANFDAISRAMRRACSEGADLLLTPEGSLSGYTPHFDRAEVAQALEATERQAREAGIGLALGTCFEEDDGRCYNQVRFYHRSGEYLGFHSKTLTCGTLDHEPAGEIRDYAVAPLRTFEIDGLCLGALICNDLWANPCCTPQDDPHLTQRLADMGAQVILHAVNGGRDGGPGSDLAWQYHEANLRMRGMAGRVWIVTVDNCAPTHMRCSAPSGVIDPTGAWVCRAPDQGEATFVYTIDR